MLKIRRPLGRLIFNMGIAIPGKTVFLIETAPCFHYMYESPVYIKTEVASQPIHFMALTSTFSWKSIMREDQLQCLSFCEVNIEADPVYNIVH